MGRVPQLSTRCLGQRARSSDSRKLDKQRVPPNSKVLIGDDVEALYFREKIVTRARSTLVPNISLMHTCIEIYLYSSTALYSPGTVNDEPE